MCAYVFDSLPLFKVFCILCTHSEGLEEESSSHNENTITESHGKSQQSSPPCSGHLLPHKLDKLSALTLLKANHSRLSKVTTVPTCSLCLKTSDLRYLEKNQSHFSQIPNLR